jgi:hypothetical protein
MMPDIDVERAAAAMVQQYGKRAIQIAELRADRHALAKQREAEHLWRSVAEAVRRKLGVE